MDVVVVGRRAEERWRIAGLLEQRAGAAASPAVATSRLAHPSTDAPDAVVLLADDERDLAWLRAHTRRSVRRGVPVVAIVSRPVLAAACRAAGAADVVTRDEDGSVPAERLRAALSDVTAPAVVIVLDRVRTA